MAYHCRAGRFDDRNGIIHENHVNLTDQPPVHVQAACRDKGSRMLVLSARIGFCGL